jgi:hypothetical protein
MAGDYLHPQYQHTRKVTDVFVLAATDYTTPAAVVSVKSANHRLYVQKISINVTTYGSDTWTFQDSAGTPVPIAHISIPAAVVALASESGSIIFDYGPTGIALTLGKNLNMTMSGTGSAGAIHIEAYERLEGAVAQASTN